jgi:hypothetical protein
VTSDWSEVDAIALRVLADHGGVAPISAFRAARLTRHQVAAVFRRGVMHRPRNGWFVDPSIPWQGAHAIRVGGLLACVSAAASWNLPVPPEAWRRLHVMVPANASRLRHNRDRTRQVRAGDDQEVELHWTSHVDTRVGWRTGLVDTLLELVDCVPGDWFVAAIDAALHRPWVGEPIMTGEELGRLADLLPRRKRTLLDLVDPLAGSCLETLVRLGLQRREVGPLTLQFSPDGRRFVDILVGERLLVEADGEEFHDPEKDALRDAFFRGLGYTVLRFTYEQIVFHLDDVLDQIEAALANL